MALESPVFVTMTDDVITSGKTDEFTQVVKDLAAAMARQTPAAALIDRNVFSQRMGKLSARSYSKIREVVRDFYPGLVADEVLTARRRGLIAGELYFYFLLLAWSCSHNILSLLNFQGFSRDARFVRRGDLSGPIIRERH